MTCLGPWFLQQQVVYSKIKVSTTHVTALLDFLPDFPLQCHAHVMFVGYPVRGFHLKQKNKRIKSAHQSLCNLKISRPCSHVTFALVSTSTLKSNMVPMVAQTQMQRMGMHPFSAFASPLTQCLKLMLMLTLRQTQTLRVNGLNTRMHSSQVHTSVAVKIY